MTKPTAKPSEDAQTESSIKAKRLRTFTFPDIEGGGPAVVIEATSLKEATDIFVKGQATA